MTLKKARWAGFFFFKEGKLSGTVREKTAKIGRTRVTQVEGDKVLPT